MALEQQRETGLGDFVFFGGPFDDYRERLGDRFYTFKAALNLWLQRGGTTIVETGTMRGPIEGWRGDGCSTLLFGEFLSHHGGHLWSCDLDPDAIANSRSVTRKYAAHISYINGNSIEFLAGFDRPIDLLYLDSFDSPRSGDASIPQLHNLQELETALPCVSERGIILLDDNWYPNGGKTRRSKERLMAEGWVCLLDSQQTLWIRE